jgi:putative ABC transport system permease protein
LRLADLLAVALSALYQQKVRTLLTTLGVVFGTFILIVSLSIGQGVEEVVRREFRQHDQLRQIHVHSGFGPSEANIPADQLLVRGAMSAAKRARIRQAMIRWWGRQNLRRPAAPLTQERIDELAHLDHVQTVVPSIYQGCRAVLGQHGADVFSCASTPENPHLRARLVAGRFFASDCEGAVVVHEYLVYLWGITADEEVEQVLGKTLRLEFHLGRRPPVMLLSLLNGRTDNLTSEENRILEKAVKQLPAAIDQMDLTQLERATLRKLLENQAPPSRAAQEVSFGEDFTIVGVLREASTSDPASGWGLGRINQSADVYLPTQTAERLFARTPQVAENGFDSAIVTVDREENLKGVIQRIKDMGLQQYSLLEFFERVRTNIVLMTFATGFVAAVALLVAALGITNTMVMGVLERTREIGVMKAVGARDRHIQSIFLVEGALIGVGGGALGLLCSWLASFPGDAIARWLMEKHAEAQLKESLFVFPLWLALGVPALATVIATLAAVYPARRAARVNPIEALRHE